MAARKNKPGAGRPTVEIRGVDINNQPVCEILILDGEIPVVTKHIYSIVLLPIESDPIDFTCGLIECGPLLE